MLYLFLLHGIINATLLAKKTKLKTARPLRPIILEPIKSHFIKLTSGKEVDLSEGLLRVFENVVTQYTRFSIMELNEDQPESSYLKIKGFIQELTLEHKQIETKCTLSETIQMVAHCMGVGTASVALKGTVGSLSMTFGLWYCKKRNSCVQLMSTSQYTLIPEFNSTVSFEMGLADASLHILSKTSLITSFRRVMKAAAKDLEQQAKSIYIPWSAKIITADLDSREISFDKGVRDRIGKNEVFEVYHVNEHGNYMLKACIHTTDVSTLQSIGIIDQTYNNLPIQAGDIVMPKILNPKQK